MLHHHPLALSKGRHDGAGKLGALGKALLKADIQMVGVGSGKQRKAALVDPHPQRVVQHLQNGQRADVDTLVVVGQLQARKHALDQHALARTRVADDADELIGWPQILLGDLHAQFGHAHVAARGKVDAVQMADI